MPGSITPQSQILDDVELTNPSNNILPVWGMAAIWELPTTNSRRHKTI